MFCPNCSEPKGNDGTQFCKRCGLDLFGLSEFVESGEADSFTPSRSKSGKGIRQGVLLLAFGLLLIPVWMFLPVIVPPNDRLIESAPSTTPGEAVAWILMWMAFIAGSVRIGYASMFEGKRGVKSQRPAEVVGDRPANSLPSGDYFRPADPGAWKNSEELFERTKARTSGEL